MNERLANIILTDVGESNPINTSLYNTISMQCTVTDYASPITMKIEGSNDKQNWGEIESKIFTANGTELVNTSFNTVFSWRRISYVSGTGTLTVIINGGNT